MKRIIKIYPVVSILVVICLLLGILTTFWGSVMYDLFAFHSKPIYCWQYFSGTFMHGSKEAPVWFIWFHLVLNTLMLLPFGGLLEYKRGSKYVFLVFITSMVISSIVFHILTQNQEIQASGISAIGYAFVTGGVMNMFSIWKNFNLGLKLFYILFNRSISHHASTKYNRLDFNLSSHVRNCQLYHGFQHQQLSTVLIKIV